MKLAMVIVAALMLQACSVNVVVAPHAIVDVGYAHKDGQDENGTVR